MGRTEPVVVIRVDKDKGYIDLSKRRVSKEDIERCTEHRIAPDHQLIGWRGWWNRVEAEGTREGKIKEKEEKLAKQLAGMPRIDTFFKLKGSQLNHRNDFEIRSDQDVPNQLAKCMMSSPKRKLQKIHNIT